MIMVLIACAFLAPRLSAEERKGCVAPNPHLRVSNAMPKPRLHRASLLLRYFLCLSVDSLAAQDRRKGCVANAPPPRLTELTLAGAYPHLSDS